MPVATLSADLPASALEWIHLLPLGTFGGRDGRGPWSVPSMEQARRIIAASLAYAGTTKAVIDYDHQTDIGVPKGGTAPAAGWITDYDLRSDGIWGRVEWTDRARAAITAREFRYISPVFNYDGKGGTVLRILRAGLTNSPALNLTALASVGATMPDFLERLAALLGLPGDADEAAVLTAVEALTKEPKPDGTAVNATAFDPALFVPRALYDGVTAQLHAARAGQAEEQAVTKVEAAITGGIVAPAMRGWALALCRQDPASFDAFVKTAPQIVTPGRMALPAHPPPGVAGRGLSGNQEAICNALGIDPQHYTQNLEG